MQNVVRCSAVLSLLVICCLWQKTFAQKVSIHGVFDGETDVGSTVHPGSLEYDSARNVYRVTGSGDNMWSTNDAFHFVWRKVSGDGALAADIAFVGAGGNAHRKACLILRQNLDSDCAYADAALHGDGLTSLQYRATKGSGTQEVRAAITAPKRLRIEKRGKMVALSVANAAEPLRRAGEGVQITLSDPFYVGLAVCAHDKNVTEQALFSNLEWSGFSAPQTKPH